MNITRHITAALLLITTVSLSSAQDKYVRNIIETGRNDNRTMVHEDFLVNRIGGRPIGSAALEDAEKWVEMKFKSWGLEVMVQEVGEINVGFNRGPWSGRMLGVDGMTLHFSTPSYTSGTKGLERGHVVIEPRTRAEFNKMKGRIKGAWVLIGGESSGWPIDRSDSMNVVRAKKIADNEAVLAHNDSVRRYNASHPDDKKDFKKPDESPALFYKEMVEAGALGFIQSAKLPITALYDRQNCYSFTLDNLPTVCDIKLDENQYKVIYDKVAQRQEVLLEFDIRNHFRPGPVKYHNIIGIKRGSQYPDEYVLIGGHLDSYDSATGAVDDANAVSVTMEAARLIALSGARPKRTIMFCIWTGEEFGLLGSKYFVQNKSVDLDKISNYFNRDGGPTVATGITVPQAMYDDFVKICRPLNDINPEFPFEVRKLKEPRQRPAKAGGSDHAYFMMEGVPVISFDLTDHKGYDFQYRDIWHTECDIYNKAYPDYLEHSAVVNAVVVLGISNLDHLLPREGCYK